MFDYETTLATIEAKLQQLIAVGNTTAAAAATARDESIALQEIINEQNTIINQLRKENELLTTGNQPVPTGTTEDIQHRINQLISTIDHSITLLEQPQYIAPNTNQ